MPQNEANNAELVALNWSPLAQGIEPVNFGAGLESSETLVATAIYSLEPHGNVLITLQGSIQAEAAMQNFMDNIQFEFHPIFEQIDVESFSLTSEEGSETLPEEQTLPQLDSAVMISFEFRPNPDATMSIRGCGYSTSAHSGNYFSATLMGNYVTAKVTVLQDSVLASIFKDGNPCGWVEGTPGNPANPPNGYDGKAHDFQLQVMGSARSVYTISGSWVVS